MDSPSSSLLIGTITFAFIEGSLITISDCSMEECEALCNQLVIMVTGEFKCIGSSQELKQRHEVGFNVLVRLDHGSSSEDIDRLTSSIEGKLPSIQLLDANPVSIMLEGGHILSKCMTISCCATIVLP